jgi:mono/diheme cytochrome c family protein
MKAAARRTGLLAVAVLSGAVAASAVLSQPKGAGQPAKAQATNTAAPTDQQQIERGRYLVAVGDCVACHTQAGGVPFAGGRPVSTPFGTVLSANLTPDQATGVGRYTVDTFYRALHEGIDHEGRHLYPAFPYNNYTNVTREDADAMYGYLRTLAPVQHDVDRNQLKFPFNVRESMLVWNWLFLDKGPLRADSSKSAEWNRGAYLVEGLGHCEACHTPRNVLGGPKHDQAFSGGAFDTWFAPDITPNLRTGIGGWSRDALIEFFRSGLNVHSAASGEMGEVVAFSTSQMNDADVSAVIAYLGDRPVSTEARPATAPTRSVMLQGQAIWQDACSACHRMDARGEPRYFPPLKNDANLQQSDPTTVIHYILAGAQHRPTERAPTPLSMPAFAWKLDDAQVAAVATYARNNWGNAAPAVTGDQVAALRRKLTPGDAVDRRPADAAVAPMAHPGPDTLAPANTDSRDNGTGNAGRAAPDSPKSRLPKSPSS